MAKKIIAVTEIRHDHGITPAGETLDASQFDKKQLEQLYDAGAIRVEDGSENREATGPSAEEVEKLRAEADKKNAEEAKNAEQEKLHAENMHVSADQSAAASSPAGEPKPTAKSASAQAVRETPNVKGNTK